MSSRTTMNHHPTVHHHNELGGDSPAPDPRGCVVVVVIHLPFIIVVEPSARRCSPPQPDLAFSRRAAARSGGPEVGQSPSSERGGSRGRGATDPPTVAALAHAFVVALAPAVVTRAKWEEGATAAVLVPRGRGRWERPPPAPTTRARRGRGRRRRLWLQLRWPASLLARR